VTYAWGPDGSNGDRIMATKRKKPTGKMAPVHTPSTQRGQTLNLWFVTAVAIVAAMIGVMFGSLAAF
jgi:hypothetical protein